MATLSLEGDTVSVGDTVWCVGCLSVLYFDMNGVWAASACNILVPMGCRAHKIQPKNESPGLLSDGLASGVLLHIFMEPENERNTCVFWNHTSNGALLCKKTPSLCSGLG